jgi:predicted permease
MHDEPRWPRYLRFWRRSVDADVNDELAFHFEQRVAEFIAAGATREEAEAQARARFGDIGNTQDELLSIGRRVDRRRDRLQSLDNLRHDLVFAMRGLRRSPGLAVACIVTIALGVGANGAMFSLADRLFNRPPSGVREPAGLRRIYARTLYGGGDVATIQSDFPYRLLTLLDSNLAPSVQLAGYTVPDTMPMTADASIAHSSIVHGAYVTPGYMPLLGIRPAFGRFFAADEQVMGTPVHVAVISDRLWRRAFDADSSVVGKPVNINRQRTTIIGVAERGFDGPDLSATDVWMPLASYPASSDGTWHKSFFSATHLRLIGRVAPGTSNEWISSVATTLVRRAYVVGVRGIKINAMRDTTATMLTGPILESLGPSIKPAPEVGIAKRLIGVTVIVLLIACANVASLLLARALGRRREIAVRIALGVSRPRLIAQLLCEGLLLAAIAAVAALLVSVWAGSALRTLLMPNTYWAGSAVDARVVLFIGLVAIGTGILAGLVPALQASHPELTDALKSGARDGGSGIGGSRLRQALLIAQVAMSVLLLYGAGLFVHSLMRLRAIDLGFDAERVIYASTCLLNPSGTYIDWETCYSPRVAQGLIETARRLEGIPGVERVALSTGGPMGGSSSMPRAYLFDGTAAPLIDGRGPVSNETSSNYLEATGSRLSRGRFFTAADRDGPPVVVVNESAARSYWPGSDAVGQCLRLSSTTAPCNTVIGVVQDSHVRDVVEQPGLQILTPFAYDSIGRPREVRTIIVRARAGQTAAVEALVRRELATTFPSQSVAFIKSVAESMATELRPWRVGLYLFGGFGILALIVAALGTYSVLSYAVTQRLHEIGVRIALGARALDVLRLVVSEGLRLATIGVAIGLAVALAASRVMQSLLYDTSPREPLVTLSVAALLVAIAAAASAVPARRAARVDPVEVLRTE